jgi:hypothetical protein
MDLCYKETLELPKCGFDLIATLNTSYEFYETFKSENIYICPKALTDESTKLKSGISVDEFEELITELIKKRLNHTKTVEKIVRRIFYLTDSNHDFQVGIYMSL